MPSIRPSLAVPVIAFLFLLSLAACNRFDKEGRLRTENLTSSAGSNRFGAMLHSDRKSVLEFVPDTFFYSGEPYTGAIAKYDGDTLLQVEGFMKNGLMDSSWRFRFKSGGVMM